MTLPRALRPVVEFPTLLRAHGFTVAPDQTVDFIAGIGLLGPRSIDDIHGAARALLAIPRERMEEFDALFRAHFLGQSLAISAPGGEDEGVEAFEARGGERDAEVAEDEVEAGREATITERLGSRTFAERETAAVLRDFARRAPERLPHRRSYRRRPARHGPDFDMRRTLREAVRRDGEVLTLAASRRKTRQRRIVLLIDVSGSMRELTEPSLRFAHALGQVAERFEAFTLGTRLTRITPALAPRRPDQALLRAAALIADIDGGTRIGGALQAFLAVPRYAGFARGAAMVVLSDGLERGDREPMVDAVRRLSRLAWRLDWLSPLAGAEDYAVETAGLRAVLPHLDTLADGSRLDALTDHMLGVGRAA